MIRGIGLGTGLQNPCAIIAVSVAADAVRWRSTAGGGGAGRRHCYIRRTDLHVQVACVAA